MKPSLRFVGGNLQNALATLPQTPHLFEATAEDLRVLLCLIAKGTHTSLAHLSAEAGCSTARVRGALAYWQECGVLEEDEGEQAVTPAKASATEQPAPSVSRPLASARELLYRTEKENADYITATGMEALIDECQRLMGRLFNPSEIAVVVGLSEQFQFDHTYIMTLMAYCAKMKKLTLRYVEKMAFGLFDEGITTPEALDVHLKRLEKSATYEGKLRKLFGMGDRALTKKEKECFGRWVCDFGYDMDIIGMAYDITVDTQQKAIVGYADKILARWHDAGCKTVSDIETLLIKEKAQRPTRKPSRTMPDPERPTSFSTEDFFSRALERSYGTVPKQDNTDKGSK